MSGVAAQAIATLVVGSVSVACDNAASLAAHKNWSEERHQAFVKDLMADFVEWSAEAFACEIAKRFGVEAAEDIRLVIARGGAQEDGQQEHLC